MTPYFTEEITLELIIFLRKHNLISHDENTIRTQRLGGGNMNFVMRVSSADRSFIFKQSRAYVEKYPQVAAPIGRVGVEALFYQTIQGNEKLSSVVPKLQLFDNEHNVLILDDLGDTRDYSFLYTPNRKLTTDEGIELVDFLLELHNIQAESFPSNMDMKELNHEHIFKYPFMEENGFDLDNIQLGLQDISMVYKTNYSLKKRMYNLGEIYLHGEAKSLLHGDYYPGSWLLTNEGIKIIDLEFSFVGCPEFDLGVMVAHLYITQHDERFIDKVIKYYQSKSLIDVSLTRSFAGVEILRRLIGLAQLPIKLDLSQREKLLAFGAKMI
jgi:5-methylthioribose kinase